MAPRAKVVEKHPQVKHVEVKFELPCDLKHKQIVFNLCHQEELKNTRAGRVAKLVWERMRCELGNGEGGVLQLTSTELALAPEELRALQYALEEERIRAGEKTPRIKEFITSREQLNFSLRREREQLQREAIKVRRELMLEREKPESDLFQELNSIVQKIARQMGFQRPIQLEIVRDPSFNAFVLNVSKEGGLEAHNTVPLRLFVNAGLIDILREALKTVTPTGSVARVVSQDHVAGIIAHELAHLKQPAWHADDRHSNAAEKQRYEYDSDSEGMRSMDRAGYNPRAFIEVFEVLQKAQKYDQLTVLLRHYLTQTHPLTENRVKELWQLYQQADQPYFSAQKIFEPLSAGALSETDRMLRKELHSDLKNVNQLGDWDKILDRLENDKQMTLRDAELVGRELKPFMDGYLALAIVEEELATNKGLAEVILYSANYIFEQIKKDTVEFNEVSKAAEEPNEPEKKETKPTFNMESIFPRTDAPRHPRIHEWAYEWTSGVGAPLTARAEYTSKAVNFEQEKRVIKFVRQHVSNELVQEKTFNTVAELFDPQNPKALELWANFHGTFRQRHSSPDVSSPDKVARELPEFFNYLKQRLLEEVCYGFDKKYVYDGEKDVNAKQIFLKLLDEIDSGNLPIATSGAFGNSILNWSRDMLAGRVSVYKEQPKTPSAPNIYVFSKPEKTLKFNLQTQLMQCPEIVPRAAYTTNELVALEQLTPLQQRVARYFKATRQIFERTLSPEFIEREYGVSVSDNQAVKQDLFEDIFVDYFFETPERVENKSRFLAADDERIFAEPERLTYSRYLFDTSRQLLVDGDGLSLGNIRPYSTHINRRARYQIYPETVASRFYQYKSEGSLSLMDFIRRMEYIRLVKHHPGFSFQLHDLFTVKAQLFTRLVRGGVFPAGEQTTEALQNILIARAESSGLPKDQWLAFTTTQDRRGFWKKLFKRGGLESIPLTETMASTLNRLFSEEFMRLFADDHEELKKCTPSTIAVIPVEEHRYSY